MTQAGQCYLCTKFGTGSLRSVYYLSFSVVWWTTARLSLSSLQPASFSGVWLVPGEGEIVTCKTLKLLEQT